MILVLDWIIVLHVHSSMLTVHVCYYQISGLDDTNHKECRSKKFAGNLF